MADCGCSSFLDGGIAIGCDTNTGGVQKIYITDFCLVDSITDTDGLISALNMSSSPAGVFYEFSFNRNTSELAETATVNLENGSIFYNQTVTLVIPRREVAKRNKLALLTLKKLAVIVKDQNGLNWYIGEANGAEVSEIGGGTGKAKSDANGYIITITAEEPVAAKEVTNAAVAAVI